MISVPKSISNRAREFIGAFRKILMSSHRRCTTELVQTFRVQTFWTLIYFLLRPNHPSPRTEPYCRIEVRDYSTSCFSETLDTHTLIAYHAHLVDDIMRNAQNRTPKTRLFTSG